jgi:hypothetical protein
MVTVRKTGKGRGQMRWIKVKGRWKALPGKTAKPLKSSIGNDQAAAERVVSMHESVERIDRKEDVEKAIELAG